MEKGTPMSPYRGLEPHHTTMEMVTRSPETKHTHTRLSHIFYKFIFYFLAQFQIKKYRFSLVFPTHVNFCTQIVALYFF